MEDRNKPTTVELPPVREREEYAQAGRVAPIEVPRPSAGQVVTVTVEKGRALKLGFAVADIQSRQIEGDDLILTLADGGKVALKGYVPAFGAGDSRFVIMQADGKSFAASELLSPGAPAGRRAPPRTTPAGDEDYVIVNKPKADEIVVVKLDPKKQPALNFGIRDVASSAMDGDTLVLRFKDGGTIRFENYKQYAENPGTKFSVGKNADIPATSVPKVFEASPGGRPDAAGPGGPGSHPFDTPFDPGKLGPGLDHLNGLPGVDFLDPVLGGPDVPPGDLPGDPPPGGGGGGGQGGNPGPQWFLDGPIAVNEAANASNALGINFLDLAPGQARSIDIKLAGVGIGGKPPVSPADIIPAAATLVAKLQAEIAAAVAVVVPPGSIVAVNLADGVRLIFASNAPLQLPFKLTALADQFIEGGEIYRLTLSDPLSLGGASASTIQAGKEKVDTEILDQSRGDWVFTGDALVVEGAPNAPKYTITLANADLVNGQTASVVVKAVFTAGAGNATPSNDASSNPDRDFGEAFFKDLQDALGATPGVTLQNLGNNMVRITLSDTAAQTLMFTLPTFDDAALEPDEKFRIELADPSVNTQLSAVPALRAVETTILDNETVVWRIDGPPQVNEGDQLTVLYTVSYTGNPVGPVSIKLDIDLPGGIGGAEAADFVVQLNTAIALGIDLDGPGGNPPIPGVTYDPVTQTLTLAPGVKSFTFFMPTLDDALVEQAEAFAIKIQNPSEGRVEQDKVVTVILDNDAPPPIAPRTFELTGDKDVSEGNAAKYWIELKGPLLTGAETASINLRIDTTGLPQPATLPGNPNPDFVQTLLQAIGTQLAGTPGIGFATVDPSGAQIAIVFSASTPRRLMFTLPTLEDAAVEGDERYRIFVANTSPGTALAPDKGEVVTTILDDDRPAGAVTWAIGGTDVVQEGSTPSYTVIRTGDPIAPGGTQTVEISVAYPGGNFGALPADFAEALLKDIQDSLVPGITAALAPNGNIRLTYDSTAPREFTFTLPTLDDATPENTEVFAVSLVNQSAGAIPLGQGIVETRILDNDLPAPTVLIGDAAAPEGDPLTFQVNLSNPSGQAITLRLATTDGTATGGLDYNDGNFLVSNDGVIFVPAANGTDVTFVPGQTQVYVRVASIEDAAIEPNETFTLRVASVLAGTVANSADTGTGTILDDDAPLWFLAGATMVDEGADAGYTLGLTQLALQPGQTRSIDIKLDFPAVAGKLPASAADFQIAVNTLFAELQEAIAAAGQGANITLAALADGVRVTFNANAPVTLPFNHSIALDGLAEGGEAYRLTISNPLNSAGAVAAPIAAGSESVTTMIVDRDMGKWELTGDAQVVEGTLGKAEYRLDLKNADLVQGQNASVVLKAVFGAGAGFATPSNAANNNPDRDFSENFLKDLQDALGGAPGVSLTDLGNNMVRVNFADTSAQNYTFSLPTLDDAVAELNESYRIEIADASANSMINPALSAVTTLIVDNDRPQWLLVGDTMTTEGGQPLYALSYVGPPVQPGQPISIKLDIELPAGLGGADAADFIESFVKDIQDAVAGQPGKTFDAITRTLTFDSTATTQLLFALPTFNDTLYESDESFTVKILNQSVGDIVAGKDAVVTTIKDNDLPPGPREIALTGDTSVAEGMAGGYTVTLAGPPLTPGETQSIDIKIVAPGGAGQAAPADFVEGFLKDLQDSLGATPGLVIADLGGGIVRLTYSGATPPALNFTLPTLDDAIVEGNESYTVMIQNPLGGAIVAAGKDMVQTVIVDNDQPGAPVWSITGASSVAEGDLPMYTVVRSGDPIGAGLSQSLDVTIKLPGLLPGAEKADFVNAFFADMLAAALTVPGSSVALAQDLPDAVTVRLTFANNPPTPVPAQFSFKLPTLDDTIYEGIEVYAVSIANPSAGTINPGEAVVETRILDNDPLVWTIGGGGPVPEGNAASFVVSLNRAAEGPVSIKLAPVLPGDVGGAEAADFVESFLKDVNDAVLALGPGAGVSFDQATATLTFLPGTQLFTFTLPTAQDLKAEGNEAFAVKILNPDVGTVAADVANAVIRDDDAPAGRNWAISGDNAVNEGAAAKYLLTLDGPTLLLGETRFVDIKLTTAGLTDPVTLPGNPNPDIVSALFADLQAAAALTSGVTVTDQGGGVVRVAFTGTNAPFAFSLPTTADALVEANENFAVMLQNPQAGTALAPDKDMVTTTIVDDDRVVGAVTWQIAGTDQVLEGGMPSYTIVRVGDPILAGQQNFLDLNVALPGGASGAEATDFIEAFLKDIQDALPAGITAAAIPNGVRLTYASTAPNNFTFGLPTFDDTTYEGIEAYTVSIVNQSTGTILPDKGAVETKIVDNDALTWKIEGATTMVEGGAPAYTVSVNRDHEDAVSIRLDTAIPGGAGAADAADFIEAFAKDVQDALVAGVTFDSATRTLTFAPGVNNYTFTLPTFDDTHPEFAEAFTVKILNPDAGAVETDKDKVLTHILDNDAPQPAVRGWELSGDNDVTEGDSIRYTLRLTGPPLTPGESKFVDIKLGTAGLTDPATLQNATNNAPGADILSNLVTTLLVDIGGIPGVTVTDLGGGVARIALTAAAPGALQFTLPVAGDALVEPAERLAAMLQNPDAGTVIAPDKGMVTTEIQDDDRTAGAVTWSLTGEELRFEGDFFNYTIVRNGNPIPAGQIQTLDLSIRYPGGADGALPQDFQRLFLAEIQDALPVGMTAQLLPGTNTVRLTFDSTASGRFSFSLELLDDAFAENTEAFALSIVNPTAGTIVPGAGVVESRILDDDAILWKLEGSAAVNEGAAARYTVSYSGKPLETVRIDVRALLPGGLGGAEAQDFVEAFQKDLADAVAALPPNSGIALFDTTLVFQPNASSSFTFTLPTLNDITPEFPEAYTIKIQNPSDGRIEPAMDAVVTTILDNDGPPPARDWILSGDTSVNEGGAAVYRLDLTGGPIPVGIQHSIQLQAIPGTLNPATVSGQPGGDFTEGFAKDLQDALAGTPGVTVVDLGGGLVELRFVNGAPTTVSFSLPTFDDANNEGDEDYAVMLQAPSPGTDIPAGKDMVTTLIADDDDSSGRSEWAITGTNLVEEGGVPSYTIVRGGETIPAGLTRSVEVVATYPGGANGALPADFAKSFLKDIQDALPPGIAASLLPGGNVLLTFDSTAPREFTFTLPTFDDAFAEDTEAYAISLANQSDGDIQPGLGAVETRILDNDTAARPQWSIKGDPSVIEGTPNAAQYTIALANAQPGQSYAVELGFASVTPGFSFADFVNPNILQSIAAQLPAGATLDTVTGQLVFAPGTTSVTFVLPTLDDAIVEGPERYTVQLAGATNGSSVMAGMDSASTAIIDNDMPPGRIAWQIEGTAQVAEGGTPNYTVSYIGGPITSPVSIQIDQVFGEGFGGADIEDFIDLLDKDIQDAIAALPPGTGISYDAASNRLTFQPGAPATFTFGVPTVQDSFKEGTESYAIQIQDPSAGSNIVAGRDNALTTIVDDDVIVSPERLWSITGDYSRVEGQTFHYTVKLVGTALAVGETASVQIVPTFPGGPNGASLSDFAFAAFSDRVAAAVAALPAGSGVSYNPGTGTLTFSGGGVTSLDFNLPTVLDAVSEGDEVYSIGLVNAANSQILQIDNAVFSIIVDDDFPPAAVEWKLSGSVLVNEGEVPTYTVSWNGPALAPGETAAVRLNLNAPGGNFGALPADFVEGFVKDIQDAIAALPPGSGISFDSGTQVLSFSATAAKQFTFALPTFDDAIAESTESYVVSLSNQNIGTIADTLGAVDTRIVDNDAIPNVRIGDAQAPEGEKLVFDVTLSGPALDAIMLRLGTTDGTATGGVDYETGTFEYSTDGGLTYLPAGGPNGRDVIIPAGAVGIKVRIDSIEDTIDEADETFTLRVDSVLGGRVGNTTDTGTGTILDDDDRPRVLIGDASASEGDPLVFDVTLTNPSTGAITIDLATTNGTATGGADFETTQFEVSTDGGQTFVAAGGANGTQVTFQPGQTALKVRVASFEDNAVEPDETFTLRVGNLVAGAADVTDTGTGTIRNDDFRPVDAKDDKDMVRVGGAPTKGNVVAGTDPDADPINQGMQVPDDLGTNPAANVTQLRYVDAAGNPQTVAVPANGQVTVTTYVGGTLTIESDGDYTYTAPAALGSSVAIGVPAGVGSSGATLAQWQSWLTPQSGNAGDPLSKAYTVSILPEGGEIAVKRVTVPNGGPTYTGVGIVGAPGDEVEIDRFGPAEALKIDFNGVCMTSATIGLAALFDGVLFDHGSREVARIEAVNSMTGQTVATVLLNGTRNGLAEATITAPPGEVFDLIRLVPVNNEAAQQPNNSDFLLQYVRADRAQIEDSFVYTIQGTGDGSTDSANLTIKIKPPAGGRLSISDAQAQEGDKLVFDVTMSEPANGATALRLGTVDGSATGGVDYEAGAFEFSTDNGATWQNAGGPAGRDVTLPNGATAIKVRIDSLEDRTDEPNETFTLRVDQVVTGTVADFADTGTGTILDDDGDGLCAKDDTDMVRAGGDVTRGNVVTGVDPDRSPDNKMALMADDLGVNGSARVLEIGYRDSDGNPAKVVVPANGRTTVTTVLGGKLTIESDGDYSYVPPPASVANDIHIGVPSGDFGAGANLAQWQAWLKPQSGDTADALAKAYTVEIGTEGGRLAVKSVSVPHGPAYTGVGIARNGMDEREIDQFPDESMTIDFRGLCMTEAKLGIAALFDGNKFDNGNVEIMRWEAWDSTTSTLVATGDVRGTRDGLAQATIAAPPGTVFDHIRVYGLDNGAEHKADNSDFLIQYVRAQDVSLVDTFTYKIKGNVDGSTDEATLAIKIKSPESDRDHAVETDAAPAASPLDQPATDDALGSPVHEDAYEPHEHRHYERLDKPWRENDDDRGWSHEPDCPPENGVILGGDADDAIFGDNVALDPATRAAFDAHEPGEPHDGDGGHETRHRHGKGDWIEAGVGDDTSAGLNPTDVLGGSVGRDTLILEGSGVFDLRGLGGASIRGIERVDMTGGGNAELKISYADLVGMTDDGKLTVNGSAGDKVTADLSGHAVQVQDNGSVTIYVIDGGAAALTVDNQMQHNVVGI